MFGGIIMNVSTPHINIINDSEIAKSILLPGDPLRAKYIAENFFENPVQFNAVRGMLGYTGTYRGKLISSMGTGMGIPSISIYATELAKFFGVKNMVRVGTCGGYVEKVKMRDILLAQGCCTNSGFIGHMFPGYYAPIADFELLRTAYDKMKERGLRGHVGLMRSTDAYYDEDFPSDDRWISYGVMGGEMECAGLYTIAAKYNVRALTMAMVTDLTYNGESLSADDREKNSLDMIQLALDSVIEFAD
jgi:purine-nucleoside phosphorylase